MNPWRCLLSLGACCLLQTASAAWLNVCVDERGTARGGHLAEYASVAGTRTTLLVRAEPLPSCTAVELPFAARTVIEGRLVAAEVGLAIAPGFALMGSELGGRFRVSEVVPPEERGASTATQAEKLPLPALIRTPARALWAWQAGTWMDAPDALLEKLARAGATTLFATVPIDQQTGKVARQATLASFVQAATQRGVRVWAVVGDPAAVMAGERTSFARLPAAYAAYNREVTAEARLAGVQFDIEPYLNAGYGLDPAAWQEAYLETLALLRRATDAKMDVVVPYWWANQQNGRLLERMAAVVDSLTVMNYRTDPEQIRRYAEPFLEWGQRHAREVRVALESGPIPDEVQRHYLPGTPGDTALVAVGSYRALLSLDRPLSIIKSGGGIQLFRQTHTTPVSGGAASFLGRREALLSLLPELERAWAAWPGFAGVALHEFEP